jgi:hypothetical protein
MAHMTAPTLVALAATIVSLTACSFDSVTNSTHLTGHGVDTLSLVTGFSGTMVTAGGNYNFAPATEIAVGDLDAANPGETQRGFVTFDVTPLAGDSALSAILRIDECAVRGDPFALLGVMVVDHITPGTPPGVTQYVGATLTSNLGTIASDNTIDFHELAVTSAVESDLTSGATYSQFRLRFSIEDGNNNGLNDYVDVRTSESGDCMADATRAPVLIVTF